MTMLTSEDANSGANSGTLGIIGGTGASLLVIFVVLSVVVLLSRRTRRTVLFLKRFSQVSRSNTNSSSGGEGNTFGSKRYLSFFKEIPKKFYKMIQKQIQISVTLQYELENEHILTPPLSRKIVENGGYGLFNGSNDFDGDIPEQYQDQSIIQEYRKRKQNVLTNIFTASNIANSHRKSFFLGTPLQQRNSNLKSFTKQHLMENLIEKDTVIHFKKIIVHCIHLIEKAAVSKDQELMRPVSQSMFEYIQNLKRIILQNGGFTKENEISWDIVAQIYDKASFSEMEITRIEYNEFMHNLHLILTLLETCTSPKVFLSPHSTFSSPSLVPSHEIHSEHHHEQQYLYRDDIHQ